MFKLKLGVTVVFSVVTDRECDSLILSTLSQVALLSLLGLWRPLPSFLTTCTFFPHMITCTVEKKITIESSSSRTCVSV